MSFRDPEAKLENTELCLTLATGCSVVAVVQWPAKEEDSCQAEIFLSPITIKCLIFTAL